MSTKPNVLPRSNTMIERLNRFHKIFQGDDRVLIIINADPDAISSAMAMKRLLWRKVAAVTMARTNIIKRPDNLALIQLTQAKLVHINQVDLKSFTRLALVDSQPHHQKELATLKFDVVIDHHPLGNNPADFLDVRPNYGANATIMTEYLRAGKIVPNRKLATALFYGIKTDTNNFVRQGQVEDVRAFRFLFPLINQNMVSKIENSELTRAALKYFNEALSRVKIRKETALVVLDRVDNPDTLVTIADFFMRVHDINQSIAAGISGDRLVVIFRMIGYRKNAGKLAAAALGQFGSAGGHRAMARAEVPLANLDPKINEKGGGLERFIQRQIKKAGQPDKTRSNSS